MKLFRDRRFVFLLAILRVFNFMDAESDMRLLMLDTAQGERYKYQPFIDSANCAGFEVKYLPVSRVMDKSISALKSEKFDAVFFLLSTEFLNRMQSSPISQRFLSLLEDYSHKPQKLIGLIFPSGIAQGMRPFNSVFEKIGIRIGIKSLDIIPGESPNSFFGRKEKESIANFVRATNSYLSTPFTTRGIGYDTSIFRPQPTYINYDIKEKITSDQKMALLPVNDNFRPEVKKLFPYGVCWSNPIKDNIIFVGNQSFVGFSSVSEDFRLTPIDGALRSNMERAAQETIYELASITKHKEINAAKINNIKLPTRTLTSKNTTNGRKITCPWMAIDIFFDDTKEKQQTQLIDYILSSNVSSLWLSIAPSWYYSPIGLRKSPTGIHGPNGVKKMVDNFTKKLRTQAEKTKQTIPKILIGFEIADNLRDTNLPYKKMAYDMYGNTYRDAPAPLSNTFWDEEVVIPFRKFLNDWEGSSNGLPVSGVVIDLEMYIKSSGSFLSTMGFDKETFNQFQSGQTINETAKISKYLMANNLSGKYFDFLTDKAQKLGLKLKDVFNDAIPNVTIGCYAPNISTDWFYKGFYKGLSTKSNPILLLTFNTVFEKHRSWLTQNNIHAKHLSALMLSKLQSEKDFAWVKNALKNHDGLWINRFSTLVEKYNQHPEHTPLSNNPNSMKMFTNYISSYNSY